MERKGRIVLVMLLAFIVVPLPIYSPIITGNQLQTSEKITITVIQIYEGTIKKVQRDFYRNGVHIQQVNISGVINGISVRIISPEYPADFISEGKVEDVHPCSPLPKKWDDSILWVLYPGNETIYVRRDHPDNYETYYPLQINTPYILKGDWRYYKHITVSMIDQWKQENDIGGLAAAVGGVIVSLLAIPELGSKVVAGVLSVYLAILVVYNRSVEYYLNWDLQTELGDGWVTIAKTAWRWGPIMSWTQSFFGYIDGWYCQAACLMCPGGGKYCQML